ncbi:VWA domain-containing protein [Roseiconus lacunae]|uniref:VWA domain-containing protein n=1 Tax=Roseiconus lacunae TaxID=2605694 RepID=A0ABT7PS24_9BACT|nr:VWA domain-containing protein [Roseiconus lacunae]MDM4019303.1 VWA domain-containing protein [Roseiconus lacunae]WRQ51884.1 VWA domain-containing protein [Stieleria sp. HD01]
MNETTAKALPRIPEDQSDQESSKKFQLVTSSSVSVLVHTVIILVLAVITVDLQKFQEFDLIALPPRPVEDDPPVEVELEPEIQVVPPETASLFSAAPAPTNMSAGAATTPVLDQTLVAKAEMSDLQIAAPTMGIPDSMALIEAIPDAKVKGEARDIVDNYQQALDRLAQELLWMLDEGPVLAIWCFDQSNSMKDDQKEIRDRIESVYQQLGLDGRSRGNALWTAVTSYGQGFVDHTAHKPTPNLDQIRAAIDAVPIDESGLEMMCSAVGRTINTYRDISRRGRQMALILVTDESGERINNDAYLEEAIEIAKAANCKVYVLGRESVFGYPYAFIRWRHPQTNRVHWLRIDRGPETGFPEQLQTNGFRRRHDAFSSGFGPYEQTRLARETNAIFFMLPSVETDLVRATKVKYDMEALRPYRPDLRARMEVLTDRKEFPLRALIWQVIQDLNPYQEKSKNVVEMRMDFSLDPQEFVQQARQEQAKAKQQLQYMARAEQSLIEGKKLRDQEADPRWQANYDLVLAQLVAYQARIYEYGVALDAFMANPKTAPQTRGDRVLHDWDIHTVKQVRTEEAKPYIDRARSMFAEIQEEHPGSPWAARAKWELDRGFGVDLRPQYDLPYKNVPNAMAPPKL